MFMTEIKIVTILLEKDTSVRKHYAKDETNISTMKDNTRLKLT